jgi:hypothetical protein
VAGRTLVSNLLQKTDNYGNIFNRNFIKMNTLHYTLDSIVNKYYVSDKLDENIPLKVYLSQFNDYDLPLFNKFELPMKMDLKLFYFKCSKTQMNLKKIC